MIYELELVTLKNLMTITNTLILRPTAAGRFYPADPTALREEIDLSLREVEVEPCERPVMAILTPHAGYPFSGSVAASAFHYVQKHPPDTALFIALSHQGVQTASVFAGQSFLTPLGEVNIDTELTEALLQDGPPMQSDPLPFDGEHSIEVNLPFLQVLYPQARVAALLISKSDEALCKSVGTRIQQALQQYPNKNVLLVVSSDLSHYPPYELAQAVDQSTLAALETLDLGRIRQTWSEWPPQPQRNLHCVMCGSAAMLATLEAALAMGAREAHVLSYRNSGDSPYGDRNRVVGYGALAIYQPYANEIRSAASSVTGYESLTEADQRELLRIVRLGLTARLSGQPAQPQCNSPALLEPKGCFVTLKNNTTLRGCIGCFVPDDNPLYLVAMQTGIDAACNDARFTSLRFEELPWVDIQISVVSTPSPIESIDDIVIGRDGLQIRGIDSNGHIRQGTLLPQVALERQWGVTEFLEAVCVKARLPKDAWEKPDAAIFTYRAQIFGDLDFGEPPFTVD